MDNQNEFTAYLHLSPIEGGSKLSCEIGGGDLIQYMVLAVATVIKVSEATGMSAKEVASKVLNVVSDDEFIKEVEK